MAKNGFMFFQIDTDILQDSRIRRLKRQERGREKFLVYFSVLKNIYSERGYYLEVNDDTTLDIAEDWGLDETFVQETLEECCKIGLFDADLYARGYISSVAIQERFSEMCKRAKRIGKIDRNINLLKSSEEKGKTSEESTQSSEEMGKNSENGKEKLHKRNNNIKDRIIEGTDVPLSDKPDAGLPSIDTNSDDESESVDEEKTGKEKAPKESINWANLVTNWNRITAGSFPPITSIENKRRQMAAARISEYGKEKFIEAIRRAVQSDFLRGQNARGFILNFDWLIRPNNFPKVLEGNYDNTPTRSSQTPNNNGTVTATKQRNAKFADFGETMAAIEAGINAGITERGISAVGK